MKRSDFYPLGLNLKQLFIEENPKKPHIFKTEPALRTNLGGGWRSGGVSFENDISFY